MFAHGLNSSHFELKNFISEFKNDYHCVCYDQRGHAASDHADFHLNVKNLGRDMREIIEYLNLENVTAIGHSMGAATIFSYVNQFGCDRLKRIWHITKTMMNPKMADTPAAFEPAMKNLCGAGFDTLTSASLWYSLFRTDQRAAIDKITVPFLYVMPETPLYSMETVNFYREHVRGKFFLEKNFPDTTHMILMEKPREVAERVRVFLQA